MKVALVSFYMMETTIPLARYLSQAGIDVDLYSLLPKGYQNTFVFDFIKDKQPEGFVDSEITRAALGENLINYLANVNTKVYIFPNERSDEYLLRDIYSAFKLAKYIKKRKYDLIHVVHSDNRFWFFLNFFIRREKTVQTLHEVTSHEANNSYPERRKLNILVNNSTPIIFHSNISLNRFLEYRQVLGRKERSKDNLVMIRFGLFETYKCFKSQSTKPIKTTEIVILNFGRIVPYKGIHLLIEAVKILQDKYPIHLIVAGEGNPYFDFNDINSYEFINRFISNEEIVDLIESCTMVVLPYISASQSGVPMAVYVFDKPVVASKIAGFKEVIDHLKTGILVDDLTGSAFAFAIETLLVNHNLLNDMEQKIKLKYSVGEFSWPFIADQTISFYKKQLATNVKKAPRTLHAFFEILFLQIYSTSVNLRMSFINKLKLLKFI
jgi:glycosyltransferase involved in cell wall biosynthesis